jgi:hypothetical protein
MRPPCTASKVDGRLCITFTDCRKRINGRSSLPLLNSRSDDFMVEEFIQELEENEKPIRRNRSRSYYRHQRNLAIERKKKIIKFTWYLYREDEITPKVVAKLDKGKIHCSCPLCQLNKISKVKYEAMEKFDKKEIEEYYKVM